MRRYQQPELFPIEQRPPIRPQHSILTPEQLAEFEEVERMWVKYLRNGSLLTTHQHTETDPMIAIAEKMLGMLTATNGNLSVREAEIALERQKTIVQYQQGAEHGVLIPLAIILPFCTDDLVLVTNKRTERLRIGRNIGTEDPNIIGRELDNAKLSAKLRQYAQLVTFDHILNRQTPVFGRAEAYVIGADEDGNHLVRVLEILAE